MKGGKRWRQLTWLIHSLKAKEIKIMLDTHFKNFKL